MSRATIIAKVDSPEEVAASEQWLATWSENLTYRSEDQGVAAASTFGTLRDRTKAMAVLPPRILIHTD